MSDYQRLAVSHLGDVTVVRFVDEELRDDVKIAEVGDELIQLAGEDESRKILLSFAEVVFLSSAALVTIIRLHKQVKATGGRLKLSSIHPGFREVFSITKLDRMLDIHENESDALTAFGKDE